ncbi:TDRD9 [Branchiostoma lanceolatum]|uniref:TDRD9 protein n=1 Tax=Branchiostoma lanceolatum TaxID=7740 RepID=A0A8J9ZI02_BRALA|nr:TDRD9 [Branchiostoma lanceolatum]
MVMRWTATSLVLNNEMSLKSLAWNREPRVVERERSIPDARMEKRTVPEAVKKFLRAVLLSEQGGVPVTRLHKDYKNLIGHVLDWRGLGFTRVEDFVKSMPDVCRLEAFGPEKELRVYGIGDPESFMSSFAIKAQIVKGPPKIRNRCKRKGQKSSPAGKGSPMGSTCNDSGENPYGLEPDHRGRYSVCMKRRLDCSDQDIKSFFSAAGQVQDIHHSEKMTFVRFKTVREATAAVNGLPSVLKGRDVSVAPAKNMTSSRDASLQTAGKRLTERPAFVSDGKRSPCYPDIKAESPTQDYPVHELIVRQLTRDTTEEEIWTLFAPFNVANVRVKKQGREEYGHAFVHFTSVKDVDEAIEELNNPVLNGQRIQLKLSKRALEARGHRLAADQGRGVPANNRTAVAPSTNKNSDAGLGLSTPVLPKDSSSVEQFSNQEPSPKFMSYSTMAQMMCECSGDREVNTAPTPAASYPEELSVIVTEVVDGCHFWGQVNLEGKNNLLELQELQTGLNQLCPAPPLPPGDRIGAAPFEGEWYRVWVQEELPGNQLQVVFVDYGNTAVLPRTEVSPLLISQFWDLPPQAVPFKLAGLTPSTSKGKDKLQEIISWQVVSVKKSPSATCEPHILEVEVYIPDATDCASVNSMMKKEQTSQGGPSFTQKTFKSAVQEEPKWQSNSSKFVPIAADDRTSDLNTSRQRAQKASTEETGAKGDVFSNNTTLTQETKHSSQQKEASRKFGDRAIQQRSDESSHHQKFQSPFLSEKEEAVLKKLSINNQRMERPYHAEMTPAWQQQGLVGRQQGSVQHKPGLLGVPITQYVPQLQFKGQMFALAAKVSEVVTPELFYLQSADPTLLNKVSQSLQEAANKRTAQELSGMKTLCRETGQVMSTYSDKHHMWRRVRIMGVLPDMINVQHVDYGTMDLTQLHNLFPLPPDLLSVPILARPACLANATPLPKDNGNWTEGANAYFKGLTANKLLFAEVSGEQVGDKLVVTLWDSVGKKNNLCQQLIDQNYAICSQPLPLMPLPRLNPSLVPGQQPLTPQPPQISSQPFFVQDQKPHFPIPQYPLFSNVPYQHPGPRQKIMLSERFSQCGDQRAHVPVFGGGGAFKMTVKAESGKERITSRGEKSGPPTGQTHGAGDSDERRYIKKDLKDQEICYEAKARNGDGIKKGPSFATMQPTKPVSHNEKQYNPGNRIGTTHRASRNSSNRFGKVRSPLSLGAQRNILHQLVSDVEVTRNKSQTNSDFSPGDKAEREGRDSDVSEISIELANRLGELIRIDTDEERENAESCTPISKGPATNQHKKGLLKEEFQGCLPTTRGMSAVDILSSQLIKLHTEE